MNDDVITSGSRIPRTPIHPSVPRINVPLSSEPTVARSLDFDKLPVEPQIAPDICPACTTPEPISELISKAASLVVVTQPTRNSSQLKPEGERSGLPIDRSEDLRTANLVDSRHPSIEPLFTRPESNDGEDGTYDPAETPDVDPTGETTHTGEKNNPIGSPRVRADVDLHITCQTVLYILAESNSLHHGAAGSDATGKRNNLSLFSEFWNFHQTPRSTLPTSDERSESVILPLGGAAAGLPTDVPYRHPQTNPIPTRTALVDSTGATSSRDQLVAEEIGQFSGSNQPEQRTACRGDPTNAFQKQDTTGTIPTIPYGGGRTSTTWGPTTSPPSS
ncbi:Uncharacterized protein APZ42_013734 [Daphnia magna]|uniref:Uncharacterized protein n=1 Tax=Daphnia magna TaxID=35525 RepID=A0A162QJQ9_9CRUS|nr:Uncharacterized protein APZ42_013734 [Daphnia magna]